MKPLLTPNEYALYNHLFTYINAPKPMPFPVATHEHFDDRKPAIHTPLWVVANDYVGPCLYIAHNLNYLSVYLIDLDGYAYIPFSENPQVDFDYELSRKAIS